MAARIDHKIARESSITNDFLHNIELIESTGFELLVDSLHEMIHDIELQTDVLITGFVDSIQHMNQINKIISKEIPIQTKLLGDIKNILYGQLTLETEEAKDKEKSAVKKNDTAGTEGFGKTVNDIDEKKGSIKELGKGLFYLAGGVIALGAALLIVNPIVAAEMVLSAWLISKAVGIFAAIAKDNDIDEKKGSIKELGKGLFYLAGGVIALGAALLIVNPIVAAEMVLSAWLISKAVGIFAAIAKDNDFKKIGLGLGILGLSIIGFGLAMVVAAPLYLLAIPGMIISAITIGLMSMAMFALGEMNKEGIITDGLLTLVGMGLGLLSYSYLLSKSMEMLGDWKTMLSGVGIVVTSIALIGSSVFLLGMVSEFLIPGMLALVGLGISMYIYAAGLQKIMDLKLPEDTGDTISNIVAAPFKAFSHISLKEIAKATLAIPAFLTLATGISLMSEGIAKIAETESKYNVDYDKVSKNISTMITTLSKPFEDIGNKLPTNYSLLSLTTGINMGKTPMERGIASIRDLGEVITSFADGLAKWGNLEKNYPDLDFNKIGSSITTVLTLTQSIFEDIGSKLPNNYSYLSLLTGINMSKTPEERGINAVKDLGSIMVTFADGLSKWGDLEKNFPNLNVTAIAGNMNTILDTTKGVFEIIGKRPENQGGSLLELLTGIEMGKTDVERGIASVRDLGTIMDTLANGVTKWMNLDTLKDKDGNPIAFDADKIKKNLETVLNTIPDVFVSMGKNASHWYESSTGFELGIEATKKMTDAVMGLGDFVSKFGDISTTSSTLDSVAKTYERIAKSVNSMKSDNLVKLNDLFVSHKGILDSPNASNDQLNKLVTKIVELLDKGNKSVEQPYSTVNQMLQGKSPADQSVDKPVALDALLKELTVELGKFNKSFSDEGSNQILQKLMAINSTLKTGTISVKPVASF